jgi:hypothetical protein
MLRSLQFLDSRTKASVEYVEPMKRLRALPALTFLITAATAWPTAADYSRQDPNVAVASSPRGREAPQYPVRLMSALSEAADSTLSAGANAG